MGKEIYIMFILIKSKMILFYIFKWIMLKISKDIGKMLYNYENVKI